MEAELSPEARYDLITRDLEEIVGGDTIMQLLRDGKDPKLYWGTATTGKPHLGYFVPIFKIADFLAAGCHVTILFADLHAFLDNLKSSWELLKHRCTWYEIIIKEMLTLIGVPLDKLCFIKGTDYQLGPKYTLDMYKLCAMTTSNQATHSGAEVVKKAESPLMSALLYPILQALDEEHLDVDIQFGGTDQRKIFMFARQFLPKIGYRKRCHLMNPLIPGLGKSGKMSSSEPNSKVDFDDSKKTIKKKFNSAFSIDGEVEGNGLLAILKHIIFKFLRAHNKSFIIQKPEAWGGERFEFESYEEFEKAFVEGTLISGDFKPSLAAAIIDLIEPLQTFIRKNQVAMNLAYPPPTRAKKGGPPPLSFTSLNARVGQIKNAVIKEGSDKLFVLTVDTGDEESPRTIVSALQGHYTSEQLIDRKIVVVVNINKSTGLIFRVTNGKNTELVGVPGDAEIGARATPVGQTGEPDKSMSKNRKEKLFKKLRVDANGFFVCGDTQIEINGTSLVTESLKDVAIAK